MSLPHAFLISAVPLWLMAGWAAPDPEPVVAPEPPSSVFGVASSAYGSLFARLMRDSLVAYWHGGSDAHNHDEPAHDEHAHDEPAHDEPAHDEHAHDEHAHDEHAHDEHAHDEHAHDEHAHDEHAHRADEPLLDQAVGLLQGLEEARLKRNSPFAVSSIHRQYLDASARWRLRLATHLDPGDFVLYEILHAATESSNPERNAMGMTPTQELAEQAIKRALAPQGGVSEALTGAGATVNLLNESSLSSAGVDASTAIRHWGILEQCLRRYRSLRGTAVSEGWWTGIPELRREELDAYAVLLERIAVGFQKQLIREGLLQLKEDSR